MLPTVAHASLSLPRRRLIWSFVDHATRTDTSVSVGGWSNWGAAQPVSRPTQHEMTMDFSSTICSFAVRAAHYGLGRSLLEQQQGCRAYQCWVPDARAAHV